MIFNLEKMSLCWAGSIRGLCFWVLALLLITGVSYAAPTINGPTGLISVPTAESLKYKEFNVAVDKLFGAAGKDGLDEWSYKLNLGTFQNWEIGVVGGTVPTEGMYLNIKYYLLSDASELPLSIAIGVENLSSTDKTDVYMVASKKLREDFGLHLGFKAIFQDSNVEPIIMGGVNFMVNEQLEILGDINGDGENYMANVGAAYYINPSFSVRTYLIDVLDAVGTQFSIGLTYSKFL